MGQNGIQVYKNRNFFHRKDPLYVELSYIEKAYDEEKQEIEKKYAEKLEELFPQVLPSELMELSQEFLGRNSESFLTLRQGFCAFNPYEESPVWGIVRNLTPKVLSGKEEILLKMQKDMEADFQGAFEGYQRKVSQLKQLKSAQKWEEQGDENKVLKNPEEDGKGDKGKRRSRSRFRKEKI